MSIGQSELLELYGLYKQVTCFGEFGSAVKPAFWRFGECRKYWSWERNSKLSKYEALEGYIEVVRRVCPEWKYDPTVRIGTGSNQKMEEEVQTHVYFPKFLTSSSLTELQLR